MSGVPHPAGPSESSALSAAAVLSPDQPAARTAFAVARPVAAYDAGDWLDAQGPCTAPLDAAIDYCRNRPERVLPLYALAMAPHAVLSVWLIDAVVAGHRSRLFGYSAALVVATLWRWAVLARLQSDIQNDLRGTPGGPFWRRLPAILWLRLAGNVAITWGSILVFPGFYGLFLGGFAAPLLLESNDAVAPRVRAGWQWIRSASGRLFRVTLVMSAASLIALAAVFASQSLLLHTVLPSLLGVDVADLTLTIESPVWTLRVCYFLGLALDAFWTVACVFLYYDSQSRRMATDLRVRLLALTGADA